MSWQWKNGIARLLPSHNIHSMLSLSTGNNTISQEVPQQDTSQAFKMVGVYLSPSGSQKKQTAILQAHADYYSSVIGSSTINLEEAYWLFSLYLRPKLTYPLTGSHLTQTPCKFIQAPALAALLPKLELNRHTPHAVLFGETKYGGLTIPNLFTDQGYGQLRLLICHISIKMTMAPCFTLLSHIWNRSQDCFPPSFHGHTLPDASRWNGMDFFCMETYTPTENYD
jgi:hypothetical protein